MLVVKAESRPPVVSTKDRSAAYRQRKGAAYNAATQARRNARLDEFVCIDGESVGKGTAHRYVLLGCNGDEDQRTQYENPNGISWKEAFEFLYSEYEKRPRAAFVGFFLTFDFNQLIKTMPQEKAWLLLTKAGKAKRANRNPNSGRTHFPVRYEGWEFDMLGGKRLQIRPMSCDCVLDGRKCPRKHRETRCECRKGCSKNHGNKPCNCKKRACSVIPSHAPKGWMSICDTGPFFQMGFLKVIHSDQWKDDPKGKVCSDEEYALVEKGKAGRGDDILDDDMRMYNHLENRILARVMGRLSEGFKTNGVKLGKDQYYGPGAAAQKWLAKEGIIKRAKLEEIMPEWAIQTCKDSYYGGWFEIFSHGLIGSKQMTTWNYDINSAYPYAIKSLPCLLHGEWKRGNGSKWDNAPYVLCHAKVISASNRVGAMPHRRKDGSILRPTCTSGWYWLDEIQASEKAGLIESYTVDKWVSFTPECDHMPLDNIQVMYDYRLQVGKNSAAGKGAKLIINSDYGKFAQSIGAAPFNNWFYASRITASCRTQILDAIASHPGKANSVLMVATDGIVFDSPHPSLPISLALGDWEAKEYHELTLFMPGVYWHNSGKDNMLKVKTRGVPKAEFENNIWQVEEQFKQWHQDKGIRAQYRFHQQARLATEEERLNIQNQQGWPGMRVPIHFSVTSCLQALMQNDWSRAGKVQEDTDKLISSDPKQKRGKTKWNSKMRRLDSLTLDPEQIESTPYQHSESSDIEIDTLGIVPDGNALDIMGEYIGALRGDTEWKIIQNEQ